MDNVKRILTGREANIALGTKYELEVSKLRAKGLRNISDQIRQKPMHQKAKLKCITTHAGIKVNKLAGESSKKQLK